VTYGRTPGGVTTLVSLSTQTPSHLPSLPKATYPLYVKIHQNTQNAGLLIPRTLFNPARPNLLSDVKTPQKPTQLFFCISPTSPSVISNKERDNKALVLSAAPNARTDIHSVSPSRGCVQVKTWKRNPSYLIGVDTLVERLFVTRWSASDPPLIGILRINLGIMKQLSGGIQIIRNFTIFALLPLFRSELQKLFAIPSGL
jgi:hypothetical protein